MEDKVQVKQKIATSACSECSLEGRDRQLACRTQSATDNKRNTLYSDDNNDISDMDRCAPSERARAMRVARPGQARHPSN